VPSVCLLFRGDCAGAQPGEGGLALEEEHAAELDAAGNLAATRALVQPALPRLRSLRGRQLGDELVECQQPSGRWLGAGNRRPFGELARDPRRERFGERVDDGRRCVRVIRLLRVCLECPQPVVEGELALGGDLALGRACHDRQNPFRHDCGLGSLSATADGIKTKP
jgi:hypothetical protein